MLGNSTTANALSLAKAFAHIADGLEKPRQADVSANALARDAIKDYAVPPHLRRFIWRLAGRLNKAMAIIDGIKQQYKVTSTGVIADKKPLFLDVYEDPDIPRYFSVKPRRFTLCFLLPEKFFEPGEIGESLDPTSPRLDDTLSYNAVQARRSQGSYRLLGYLSIAISHRETNLYQDLADVIKHEEGHVLFGFIRAPCRTPFFGEVPADLYARCLAGHDVKGQQVRATRHHYRFRQNAYERIKARKAPPSVVQQERALLQEQVKLLEHAKQFPLGIVRSIGHQGLDRRVLAMSIVQSDYHRTEHDLLRLHEYLQKNPSAIEYQRDTST